MVCSIACLYVVRFGLRRGYENQLHLASIRDERGQTHLVYSSIWLLMYSEVAAGAGKEGQVSLRARERRRHDTAHGSPSGRTRRSCRPCAGTRGRSRCEGDQGTLRCDKAEFRSRVAGRGVSARAQVVSEGLETTNRAFPIPAVGRPSIQLRSLRQFEVSSVSKRRLGARGRAAGAAGSPTAPQQFQRKESTHPG